MLPLGKPQALRVYICPSPSPATTSGSPAPSAHGCLPFDSSKLQPTLFRFIILFIPRETLRRGTKKRDFGRGTKKMCHPKDPWTLQWRGWNLYSRAPGSQNRHFWGVRILRAINWVMMFPNPPLNPPENVVPKSMTRHSRRRDECLRNWGVGYPISMVKPLMNGGWDVDSVLTTCICGLLSLLSKKQHIPLLVGGFNPSGKICSSNWKSSPIFGVNQWKKTYLTPPRNHGKSTQPPLTCPPRNKALLRACIRGS